MGRTELRETEAPARRAGGAAEREHGTEKRGRKNDDETETECMEHVRSLRLRG